MAERAIRHAPAIAATPWLRLLPPATRLVLRGAPAVLARADDVLGIALAPAACRAAVSGVYAALWQGPDEQLLLAPETALAGLSAQLAAALAGLAHSLVDVSHRQVAFELAGARAAALLNGACPLDLDPREFPAGMCTRTVFAKAEIVLWRTAPEVFRLEVWRSFAGYVAGLLGEIARDTAAGPGAGST
jgi:sarcosine oxidase subunit gamma